MTPARRRPTDQIAAVTVGQVTHDRYDDKIVAGGCAFYSARTLQALGAQVSLITSVGRDFQCDDELAGLEVVRSVGEHTTVFTNTYPPNEPRIQWIETTAPRLDPTGPLPRTTDVDVLFIAPVFEELELAGWTDRITTRVTGLGLQGMLKTAGAADLGDGQRRRVIKKDFAVDPKVFTGIDAVFFSEEDKIVFGSDRLLEDLHRAVPLVVMTNGDRGARVFQGADQFDVGVVRAQPDADPTGAGDTYAASFLYALATGQTPHQAAQLAAAAASIVVEGRGGETLGRVGEAFDRVQRVSAATAR